MNDSFSVDTNAGYAAFIRMVGKLTGEAKYTGTHGRSWMFSSSIPEKEWRERFTGDSYEMNLFGSDLAAYNDLCVQMLSAVR